MSGRSIAPPLSNGRLPADSRQARGNGQRFSLTAQIAEVRHELRMRAEVYPRLVASRKLRQGEADYHTNCLEAVLSTLTWLQENEPAIRQAIGSRGATSNEGGRDGGSGN